LPLKPKWAEGTTVELWLPQADEPPSQAADDVREI
jgi:hypothetical protein